MAPSMRSYAARARAHSRRMEATASASSRAFHPSASGSGAARCKATDAAWSVSSSAST